MEDFVENWAHNMRRKFYRLVEFVGAVCRDACRDLRNWRRFRWRDMLYYLGLCGEKSVSIVLLICFLMGMVLALQAALQMRKFGTELFVADLVGFSLLKELGPLMVAMIATGRAGSAFAAEIGTMKVNEEISAMTTMGISPVRFLVIPKLLAMMIALPLLTVFGDFAGLLGGLFIGTTWLDIPAAAYWNRTMAVLAPMNLLLGLVKSWIFAILVTLAGCWRGFEAEPDAQGVGRGATDAVVLSILLIVIGDMLLTMFFASFGY
ncbi:MAG: ABC transporter permease [Lentisphaeria bacterium]|nr:ABC transporter permease [Lentisphaeria bacterium]